MSRLGRQESLLVPKKRMRCTRVGTSKNGVVRRRTAIKNEVWGMDFMQG